MSEADRQVDQPLAQLERGNRRLRAQQRLDRTQLPKQRGAEAEEQRRANVADALRAAADDRRLALEPLVERGGRRLPQRGVHLGHRLPHAHHLDQLLQRRELVGRESAAAAEAAVDRAVGAAARARLGVPLARRAERRRERPARPEEVGLRRRAAHARHDAPEEAANRVRWEEGDGIEPEGASKTVIVSQEDFECCRLGCCRDWGQPSPVLGPAVARQ